jgi:putative membrane protein
MFGKRITLAASASLIGASFLLAQAPRTLEQGKDLPNQKPAETPAAPGTQVPAAQVPGTQVPGTQVPGAQVPGTQVPTTQVPGNRVPGTQVPAAQVPAAQPQPRSSDNSQNTQQNQDNAQRPPSDDAKFIVKAGEINLAEINIGRLAAQRASRQDVRQFANQLVQDHQMNLSKLNDMANRNRWRSAERMDQEHQQLFQKLASLQGQAFDREFVQAMVDGHKKVVEIFKHASENCKNADIKQFASQTLATIQQHEKEAQRLNGQNQAQPTQPTSAENNNNNRTDGNRNDVNRDGNTNRNDNSQNRRDDR